ncbi:MAG: CAP domain-containing protein, partial [Phycisphaerales bacterium]|nr:CAP domain-containing protein [Phycisphaerales bacterium]
EIRDLEEAVRRVDAYLTLATGTGLGEVSLRTPPDAPTSQKRILAGRDHSGLEDTIWLLLHARIGLVNETISRADELLRHGDKLTPWERVVTADLRDTALTAYVQDVVATSMDDAERQFIDQLNRYRRTLMLRPVEPDERLVRSSRKHSEEMVKLGYFGHVSPVAERRSPSDRARLEGFGAGVGENCLAGGVDGTGAFEGWYHSPGHHRNMVGAGPVLGIGATADHGMWTMVIGSGDDAWRLAHRDVLPARRTELGAEMIRTLGELRRPRKDSSPAPRGTGEETLAATPARRPAAAAPRAAPPTGPSPARCSASR